MPVSRYGSDPNSSAAPFNFCVCGAASCITGLFLQAGESAPYTSRLFLRAAVHFARFLARAQFRARKTGKCTSSRRSERASRTKVRVGALLSSICRTLQLLATLPVRLCFPTCDAYDNCMSHDSEAPSLGFQACACVRKVRGACLSSQCRAPRGRSLR